MYYDPISSGYIGILPEGPLVVLVEVFKALKLVYLEVVLPQRWSEEWVDAPVFRIRGVWSEISLSLGSTEQRENLSSQSVLTRTLSSFSKIGLSSGPAQVYWRPNITI